MAPMQQADGFWVVHMEQEGKYVERHFPHFVDYTKELWSRKHQGLFSVDYIDFMLKVALAKGRVAGKTTSNPSAPAYAISDNKGNVIDSARAFQSLQNRNWFAKYDDSIKGYKLVQVGKRSRGRKGEGMNEEEKDVVSLPHIDKAIEAAHKTMGVHTGQRATWKKVARTAVGVPFECVQNFVKNCTICSSGQGQRRASKRKRGSAIQEEKPFDRVQADVVHMGRDSTRGYGYRLDIIDHFSKFVAIYPLYRATAREVAQKLKMAFSFTGFPLILHTDNGTEFRGRVEVNGKTVIETLQEFCPSLRMVHGEPRRSQTQGQVERIHRTIHSRLQSACQEKDGHSLNWPDYLADVQLAMNNTAPQGFHATPIELLHNFTPMGLASNGRLTGSHAGEVLSESGYEAKFNEHPLAQMRDGSRLEQEDGDAEEVRVCQRAKQRGEAQSSMEAKIKAVKAEVYTWKNEKKADIAERLLDAVYDYHKAEADGNETTENTKIDREAQLGQNDYEKQVHRVERQLNRQMEKETKFDVGDHVSVLLPSERIGKLDPASVIGRVIQVKDEKLQSDPKGKTAQRKYKIATPTGLISQWLGGDKLGRSHRGPSDAEARAISRRMQDEDVETLEEFIRGYVGSHKRRRIGCKCSQKCDNRCSCVQAGNACTLSCHSQDGVKCGNDVDKPRWDERKGARQDDEGNRSGHPWPGSNQASPKEESNDGDKFGRAKGDERKGARQGDEGNRSGHPWQGSNQASPKEEPNYGDKLDGAKGDERKGARQDDEGNRSGHPWPGSKQASPKEEREKGTCANLVVGSGWLNNSWQELECRARDIGRRVVDVRGDGDCMLHALVRALQAMHGQQWTTDELRSVMVTQIDWNREKYGPRSSDSFIEQLKDVSSFKEYYILQAVADAFGVRVRLLTMISSDGDQVFMPEQDAQNTEIVLAFHFPENGVGHFVPCLASHDGKKKELEEQSGDSDDIDHSCLSDTGVLDQLNAVCVDVSHDGDCGVEAAMLSSGELRIGQEDMQTRKWSPSRDEKAMVNKFRQDIVRWIPQRMLSKRTMSQRRVWVANEFFSAVAHWARKPVIVLEDDIMAQKNQRGGLDSVKLYRSEGGISPKPELVPRHKAVRKHQTPDAIWIFYVPCVHFKAVIANKGIRDSISEEQGRRKQERSNQYVKTTIKDAIARQRRQAAVGKYSRSNDTITLRIRANGPDIYFHSNGLIGTRALNDVLNQREVPIRRECLFTHGLLESTESIDELDTGLQCPEEVIAIAYLAFSHENCENMKVIIFFMDENDIVREPVLLKANEGVIPFTNPSLKGVKSSIETARDDPQGIVPPSGLVDPFYSHFEPDSVEFVMHSVELPIILVYIDHDRWKLCTLTRVKEKQF